MPVLISELLANNAAPTGDQIVTCDAADPVSVAVAKISERNIGAVVVTRDEHVVGVFSERDAVKGINAAGAGFLEKTLDSAMITEIIIVGPNQSVDEALAIMRDKKIRHLPVIKDNQLAGLVSMRDLMTQKLAAINSTVEFLKGQVQVISSPLPM